MEHSIHQNYDHGCISPAHHQPRSEHSSGVDMNLQAKHSHHHTSVEASGTYSNGPGSVTVTAGHGPGGNNVGVSGSWKF